MPRQQPPRRPNHKGQYGQRQSLPSMATPRRPEPPRRSGFLGLIIVIGFLGGIVWLAMLILGWGPYGGEPLENTPTQTSLALLIDTATPTPPATATSMPTRTPVPTATPTNTPTITPSPTLELLPFIIFGEQENLSSDLIRPMLGCDWLVIAGQVWDLQDKPVTGLTLHLWGELEGFTIDKFMLTGSATTYGQSGYEFTLENLVVNSEDSLFIQLTDTNGIPLSHPYAIQTFADCNQNLILINFKQVR